MDSSNIVISAQTAAATSDAFTLAGEAKIITSGLADGEYVVLLEEEPGGTYVNAVNNGGVGVFLTHKQPSQIVVGYGSYKLSKTVTGAEVAVAVITA